MVTATAKATATTPSLWDVDLISLKAARESGEIPPKDNGKPVSRNTVTKWAKTGVNGVRLEVIYVGGVARTSRQALRRFFNAVARRHGVAAN